MEITFKKPILLSRIPEYKGECIPTWINNNMVDRVCDGGVTGFFKLCKKSRFGFYYTYGEEFHGIIRGNEIFSTKIMIDEWEE